jgi:hypothetical protein
MLDVGCEKMKVKRKEREERRETLEPGLYLICTELGAR